MCCRYESAVWELVKKGKSEKKFHHYNSGLFLLRANLRRVMLEQKNHEKTRLKSELEMNEQEKEARLETLRRLGRRRLGLDLVKHEEEISTARQGTWAWNERTRVLETERLAR